MKKRVTLIIMMMLALALLLTSCITRTPTESDTNTGTDIVTPPDDKPGDTNEGEDPGTTDPSTCRHTVVIDERVEPTCEQEGYTEGRHCPSCGKVFIAQRPIAPIGHSEVPNQDALPTCSEYGYTGGTHCENCNMEMDPATQIAKVPHIEADKPTVPSTCTTPGSVGGKYCTVCGEILVSPMVVPVKGHKEVPNEEVLPTCTKAGKTGGSHCSVCDAELTKSTVVPATGHTEVDSGYIAPTCSEFGSTGGTHCSSCGEILSQGTQIPKTAHTEVTNDYLAPTCTKVGYSGGTICDVCGEIIKKGTELKALGHNETVLAGYAPTCSKTGLTEGKHCSRCNTDTVKQMVLDKISHTEVVTPAVAPTCQNVGYTEKRQCSVCGEVTLKSEQIPKIGHTVVIDKAVPATCSATGLTEGSHCGVCNTVLSTQQVVAKNNNHVYPDFVTVTKQPTTSSAGSGTLTCTKCSNKTTVTLQKLTFAQLTKDDIYSVETDIYNVAYDGRWKVVDGNTDVSGIYSSGDWFGDKGDILTITLKQEMALSSIKVYTAGNWTYGTIRVKDSKGNVTASKTVCANGAAYGGTAQEHTIYNSSTAVKAYTIEIEIGDIKGIGTFKVSEVVMRAAPIDTKMEHTHDYREFIETTRVATCQATGIDICKCFCGKESEISTPKADHKYNTLKEITLVSCTSKGKAIYACDCGATETTETEPIGHIFDKLVSCSITPTRSTKGEAQYKCVNCSLTEDRILDYLPLEEINYLRVDKIEGGKVVLKLNIYEQRPSYEVRYSTSPITEENYESATILDANVSGTALVTITVNLDAGLNKCYYVAVKPYEGENYGEMSTVRVGGNLDIPIDYDKAQVYHGEVLNSFKVMFDGDTATTLGKVFPNPGEDEEDISGSPVRPIVDLEYGHYVTKARLYYAESGKSFTVRWSDTPLDFMSENSQWDGYITKTSTSGWNEVSINAYTRYIQVIFTDGEAPSEVEAYGYQCGEGDEISTWKNTEKPTMGELIGMCGFVASGGGNTPIDSVSCVGVLREYHNFGWSYVASNYGAKANDFTTTWMGNFDEQYRLYKAAGINVIPCVQWSLGNGETISYKVGGNNLPVTNSSGALVRASFWERFNPHTYFVYADNMFAFSARYGRNSSQSLLQIAQAHCKDTASVGQGTIEWIEMGNEPDGGWNGIHNYLSAYQLAAATSAAYDGHCATMVSPVAGGYHLGGKNADPSMKLALAGVSAVSNEYITAMCYWMKANRNDGSTAFDAFNVHNYMTKSIELPNGSTTYVGISPEEAKIQETLSALLELRDKYYPEKEVWITEFGWDTNQSYATSTSAHAYGNYTGRQVQAMWLTRTYLLLSAIGIDKADMYMCEDTGPEETSVGKYNTSGVIAFEKDANGNTIEVKKDSYYYLYTLKNTLGAYSFDSEIEAYDENVMIYKYTSAGGKTAYALWCKTSDGTTSMGYHLGINAEGATLVEAVNGDIDGVETSLTADEYGYVQVDVSENPVYVIVD